MEIVLKFVLEKHFQRDIHLLFSCSPPKWTEGFLKFGLGKMKDNNIRSLPHPTPCPVCFLFFKFSSNLHQRLLNDINVNLWQHSYCVWSLLTAKWLCENSSLYCSFIGKVFENQNDFYELQKGVIANCLNACERILPLIHRIHCHVGNSNPHRMLVPAHVSAAVMWVAQYLQVYKQICCKQDARNSHGHSASLVRERFEGLNGLIRLE